MQSLPQVLYLHGCVAIGYCVRDNTKGSLRRVCGRCGDQYRPSRLLYPVAQKDYESDPACDRLTEFGEWPVWLPDSRHVMFASGCRQGRQSSRRPGKERAESSLYQPAFVVGPVRVDASQNEW